MNAEETKQIAEQAKHVTQANNLHELAPNQVAAALGKYECTDLGNAEMFRDYAYSTLRYVYEWKSWIYWDGKRWRKDEYSAARRIAYKLIQDIMPEMAKYIPSDKQRTNFYKHIGMSQSRNRIDAMIDLASSWMQIKADNLDADPWLLNCENGTIDLINSKLQPHNQDDLNTKLMPVEYDPNATCPTWETFLADAMKDENGNERPELVNFLQRSLGICLTGEWQKALWVLHGDTDTGKTTFINAVHRVLGGEYAAKSFDDLLLSNKHKNQSHKETEAALQGVRFTYVSEPEDGSRFNEAKIKDLTGGGEITAMRKYESQFTFSPTHKIFMDTNHKPTFKGEDSAFVNRLMCVPWDNKKSEDEKDTSLPEKLESEASGILNWMLEGLKAWQAEGLNPPKIVLDARQEYADENDLIGQFISEETHDDPEGTISVPVLYRWYQDWCQNNGMMKIKTQINFSKKLKERGYKQTRASNARYWQGLKAGPKQQQQQQTKEIETKPEAKEMPDFFEKLEQMEQTTNEGAK